MRRVLATATIALLCVVPAVLIPFDLIAFNYVAVLALLCISPVALIGAVALTVAMTDRPMLRSRSGT
jgi:hypothetical protein